MTSEAAVIPSLGDWRGSAEMHPSLVVDVFTPRPLEGNQLGVFLDGRPLGAEQMQRIARELNVAETVFLLPAEHGGDVRVRIFTPAYELPFAGHPILGTAFVVGQALGAGALTLETAAGPAPIVLERDGMRQPIPPWAVRARARAARRGGAQAARRVHQLLRRRRALMEDAQLRPGRGHPRGPGHRLRGGAARRPPRATPRHPLVEVAGHAVIVAEGRIRTAA